MFEVKKHLIKVAGNQLYLPVSARLVWFRQEHPDWGIETRPVAIDTEKQYAIFEASVFNTDGKLMAKGTKMEDARGFSDYIEKAETGAIGRALAVCGFGTQFAPDLDETASGHTVDSPQPMGNGRYSSSGNGYGARRSNGYSGGGSNLRPAPRQSAESPASTASQTRTAAHSETDHTPSAEQSSPVESAASAEKDAVTDHECAGCGRSLTKGQELLSVRKYGIALCPECQKERKTAEAAAG